MLYLRSALFLAWFAAVSLVMHVVCLPTLLMERRFATKAARQWARLTLWGLRAFAGLSYEVRGGDYRPAAAALVACKHYCMWETIAFATLLDDPAIVIKRELLDVPLYGWYLRKLEMISVDRAAGASAMRAMLNAARQALAHGRPILIFPEGTRRDVGAPPAYKPGVVGLYAELNVPCVPVALNSGLFWVAGGLLKKPGTIVLEFLDPIRPGLPRKEFADLLEQRIETASQRLIEEGRRQLQQ